MRILSFLARIGRYGIIKQERFIIKVYFILLNNLAYFYFKKNNIPKAIYFAKRSLETSQNLYEADAERFNVDYVAALMNLVLLYDEQISEEIRLGMLESFYQDNPALLNAKYKKTLRNLHNYPSKENRSNEIIKLLEKALPILEHLYSKDTEHWAYEYIKSLNDLTQLYQEKNLNSKSMLLAKKSVNILENIYQNNMYDWAEHCYLMALSNLSICYIRRETEDDVLYALSLMDKEYSIILNKEEVDVSCSEIDV